MEISAAQVVKQLVERLNHHAGATCLPDKFHRNSARTGLNFYSYANFLIPLKMSHWKRFYIRKLTTLNI